jgi:hypothetical protein
MPNHPVMIRPGFYTQIENDRPPQSPREMQGPEGERNVPQAANPGQGEHTPPTKPEGPD